MGDRAAAAGDRGDRRGFADIVRALPEAVAGARGERVVETAFESRARREGNGVGYDTIAAAGAARLHAALDP